MEELNSVTVSGLPKLPNLTRTFRFEGKPLRRKRARGLF
jgi:hypothetical protein